MARRKKQPESESPSRRLALSEPRVTALSDHALSPQDYEKDTFSLIYRLGPILDILRHPDTRTPLAIAVYGDWGSGKTSGMKWLHGLLDTWNEEGEAGDKITVKPVWFYPWKYHDKEDVWRGLISEVIIASIGVENASVPTVTNAVKQFGMFLGRGFVHVLAGLTLKAGKGVEAELSLAGIKDILVDYRETAHPEKAFLNDFESALEKWISTTLGPNERMVIFIDDLDRCMPDVALEVLEALKLYLNIEKLVFVVGVDCGVVREMVKHYYENLGVSEEKSKGYLAKMFQVEVELAPPEAQVGQFLQQQLGDMSQWREHLSKDERKLFEGLILKLAGRNPRQVKRLVNSAMMAASGFLMAAEPGTEDLSLRFKQGMQVFFVRTILAESYTRGTLVGSAVGDDFLGMWSEACRKAHPPQGRLVVPKEFLDSRPREVEAASEMSIPEFLRIRVPDLSFAPGVYHGLLVDDRFVEFLPLLADADLGSLMVIPYPSQSEEIRAVIGSQANRQIILEAAARTLGLKPEVMSDEQFRTAEQLDLRGTEVSDIEPLGALAKLEILDLSRTQVSDIEPLRALANLRRLALSGTQVSDIEPLGALANLLWLFLSETRVWDIGPLGALANLGWLFLSGTQVSDIEPLRALANLQELYLSGTQVSDVEPLRALANLHVLDLRETQVSDIEPLGALANLLWLDLRGTQVSAEALAALRRDLPGTDIRADEPEE